MGESGNGSPKVLQLLQLSAIDAAALASLERLLDSRGGFVRAAAPPGDALEPFLVVFDDPVAGLEFLRKSQRVAPSYLLATRELDEEWQLRLLAAGAEDLLVTDTTMEERLERLMWGVGRWWETRALMESEVVRQKLAGVSSCWMRALRELVELATSPASAVLLCGETGTGKEAGAALIHELGYTRRGEFVVVDCGAIVETLSGSELFGHRRGAFTGADRDRDGAFSRANGGTLFLDEVAELTPALQAELLRVLQNGTYKPVGDDRPRTSRFRLVAASHRDLSALVQRGEFRMDLYHRISGAVCRLPALRERKEDVAELVRRFLEETLGDHRCIELEPSLERLLRRLPYKGNVRELKALVQVMAARYDGGPNLRLSHLPRALLAEVCAMGPEKWDSGALDAMVEQAICDGATFSEIVDGAREAAVRAALRLAEGNTREAAIRLGVSERCVQLRRRGPRDRGGGNALDAPS